MEFDIQYFYGCVSRGALHEIIDYTSRFPEAEREYEAYLDLFEREKYWCYSLPDPLEQILLCYQKYYREVFYLLEPEEDCAARLRDRLLTFFSDAGKDIPLLRLEDDRISPLFRENDLYFIGGRASGYCNPFVWHTTESKSYDVELPSGTRPFTLRFLSGIVMLGWSDYLSNGSYMVGGFVGNDGIINCFHETYDLQSEDFNICLLKHEAQHVVDLERWPNISDEALEYRAYLIELIYSRERNRLLHFVNSADLSNPDNDHAVAAYYIVHDFAHSLGTEDFASVPINVIQHTAREILAISDQQAETAFSSNE